MALVPMSVDPVDEDIGLDDGDKAVLLADTVVVRQAVRGLVDDVVGGELFATSMRRAVRHLENWALRA